MTQMRRNQKKRHPWRYGSIIVLILFIGTYLYKTTQYEHRFLPGTQVNGINIGKQSVDVANHTLEQALTQQAFEIQLDGQSWKTLSKQDLGIRTDFKPELQHQLEQQNHWAWPLAYVTPIGKKKLKNVDFDEQVLNKTLEQVSADLQKVNEKREPTENARIEKQNGEFVIIPEQNGNQLDIPIIQDTLKQAIVSGQSSLDISSLKKTPDITESSPEIKEGMQQIHNITTADYNYIINGQTVPIPKETLLDWIQFDQGTVSLDPNAVSNYVAQLGATYDTSSVPTSFQSTLRGTVSVPPGTYGWSIQTNAEAEQLTQDILSGEGMHRPPITQGSATPDQPLIGDTYIEVDLQNQHMWYYKNGALFLNTDVVTGKPSTPTPAGVFYVWNKERNTVLSGPTWRSPVDYWMPIDWTGVGIHDSNWQSAYGGNLWQTVGSHGCVNTPPSVVAQLFENTAVGTPVIVY